MFCLYRIKMLALEKCALKNVFLNHNFSSGDYISAANTRTTTILTPLKDMYLRYSKIVTTYSYLNHIVLLDIANIKQLQYIFEERNIQVPSLIFVGNLVLLGWLIISRIDCASFSAVVSLHRLTQEGCPEIDKLPEDVSNSS